MPIWLATHDPNSIDLLWWFICKCIHRTSRAQSIAWHVWSAARLITCARMWNKSAKLFRHVAAQDWFQASWAVQATVMHTAQAFFSAIVATRTACWRTPSKSVCHICMWHLHWRYCNLLGGNVPRIAALHDFDAFQTLLAFPLLNVDIFKSFQISQTWQEQHLQVYLSVLKSSIGVCLLDFRGDAYSLCLQSKTPCTWPTRMNEQVESAWMETVLCHM